MTGVLPEAEPLSATGGPVGCLVTVLAPSASDHLAATLGGPVERVSLERSYHVATIDHDRDLIIERIRDFVSRVTG